MNWPCKFRMSSSLSCGKGLSNTAERFSVTDTSSSLVPIFDQKATDLRIAWSTRPKQSHLPMTSSKRTLDTINDIVMLPLVSLKPLTWMPVNAFGCTKRSAGRIWKSSASSFGVQHRSFTSSAPAFGKRVTPMQHFSRLRVTCTRNLPPTTRGAELTLQPPSPVPESKVVVRRITPARGDFPFKTVNSRPAPGSETTMACSLENAPRWTSKVTSKPTS
mmetsp:Transcript_114193/g.329845  ORF Transcript_114193/g.329845 Transcript_114193/m.329845 type:complete len:218 (+) Transcript_114193:2738-3391(+)